MANNPYCPHIDTIERIPPSSKVCDECVAMGDDWVHLRACVSCGHVGCCDASKNKHATKHYHRSQHPLIQTIEPVEVPTGRPIAPDVPMSASLAIKRATSREPKMRYKTVSEFARGLTDASVQTVASEQIYREEPKIRAKRSPIWAILLIGGLLAAGYLLR